MIKQKKEPPYYENEVSTRYLAKIYQSGTDAPEVTVIKNNMSGPIVWTRIATGAYQGKLTNAFPERTLCMIGQPGGTEQFYIFEQLGLGVIILFTYDGSTSQDDMLNGVSIEVTTYKEFGT